MHLPGPYGPLTSVQARREVAARGQGSVARGERRKGILPFPVATLCIPGYSGYLGYFSKTFF